MSRSEIITGPEFSEEALALLFINKNSHKLRYVANWNRWLIYNGMIWKDDHTRAVFDMVRELCRDVANDCARLSSNQRKPEKLASAATVSAVEKLARSDRRVAITPDDLDKDLWIINSPGGVIDLRKATIGKHRPADHLTKITAVAPEGECPQWQAFLNDITLEDTALQGFLQRMVGYGLSGSIEEHAFFFLYGTGGNGKGVFLNTVSAVLQDYAVTASMETFTASQYDRHPADLAMLRGARFVTAQETEEGKRWAESRIKALTGGDPITARYMRQDFFTFSPQFKLIIAGNHKPGLRNVDEAMRRRMYLVPFTMNLPPERRDKNLPDKLKAEWPGILRWAIQGVAAWQEQGLNPPPVVQNATAEYMSAEDAIERWIEECCVLGNNTATATDIFQSYKAWCDQTGEFSGSQKRLMQVLRTKRPELKDWQCSTTRRKGVQGLQVIKPVQPHWSES